MFNDDSFFSETASLLLFLDKGSSRTTGALLKNTLTAPSPLVTENLHGTDTVTGTIGVKSDRRFTIAGYVNTSHGRVATSINQHQDFSSTQNIDFDTVNFTVLNQKTSVHTSVTSDTTVSSSQGSVITHDDFSFRLYRGLLVFPAEAASPFGFTVSTMQDYEAGKKVTHYGDLVRFTSVTNSEKATDGSPPEFAALYRGQLKRALFTIATSPRKDTHVDQRQPGGARRSSLK